MNIDIYQDDEMLIVHFLSLKENVDKNPPINDAQITIGENGKHGFYQNIGTKSNQVMLMNNGEWFLQISEQNAKHIPVGTHEITIKCFDEKKNVLIKESGFINVKPGNKPEDKHAQASSEKELEEMLEEKMPKVSDADAEKVTPIDLLNSKNYTTKEIRNERFDICKECPRLFKPTKTCKECGCFMAMKTWLKDATCPIGKW